MKEYITITNDKNKKHTFYSFRELVEYLDSFTMSFLPDNFSYEIKNRNGDQNKTKLEIVNKLKEIIVHARDYEIDAESQNDSYEFLITDVENLLEELQKKFGVTATFVDDDGILR